MWKVLSTCYAWQKCNQGGIASQSNLSIRVLLLSIRLPNLETKQAAGKVREDQFTTPATMYGINKLYCEHLGRYYSKHYKQLANNANPDELLDFRALRFPGLISSETVPTGRHQRLWS